jgi:hypothetical protein
MRWLGEDPGAVPPILKSEDALDGPHPLNVPGDLYVENSEGIPCGAPHSDTATGMFYPRDNS